MMVDVNFIKKQITHNRKTDDLTFYVVLFPGQVKEDDIEVGELFTDCMSSLS